MYVSRSPHRSYPLTPLMTFFGSTDRIERLLGQGTFGKVVEALDMNTRQWVAVKVIRAVQKYRYAGPLVLASCRSSSTSLVYRDASKVEIKVLNLLRERDPDNQQCVSRPGPQMAKPDRG